MAHVLSVDLVKHNRGGFKGPKRDGGHQGGQGGTWTAFRPDLLRDKWSLRNSSGLPVEPRQASRKQTMPDVRYGSWCFVPRKSMNFVDFQGL